MPTEHNTFIEPVVTMTAAERTCTSCQATKPIEAFAFRSRAALTRHHICRSCHAPKSQSAYAATAESRRAEIAQRRRAEQAAVDAAVGAWLEGRSCEVALCTPVRTTRLLAVAGGENLRRMVKSGRPAAKIIDALDDATAVCLSCRMKTG